MSNIILLSWLSPKLKENITPVTFQNNFASSAGITKAESNINIY